MAQKVWTNEALVAADFNTYLTGEGGAWTTFTPSVVQSGSVTVTNTRSRYARWGRLIIVTAKLAVTGSGTGSNTVTVSTPVTAASTDAVLLGFGTIFDSSASLEYKGIPYLASTSTVGLVPTNSTATGALGANQFTAGLASGDIISIAFAYEAAS
jgi:hypothetical protein